MLSGDPVSLVYLALLSELMAVTADSAIMHPKEKIIALKCRS
jgi:hypothetical protein